MYSILFQTQDFTLIFKATKKQPILGCTFQTELEDGEDGKRSFIFNFFFNKTTVHVDFENFKRAKSSKSSEATHDLCEEQTKIY